MKIVPLTQGFEAVIDDEDYDFLTEWKWSVHKSLRTCYAVRRRRQSDGPGASKIYMHSVIFARMGFAGTPDHKSGVGLDNCRANLRPATKSQQGANTRIRSDNTSGFKGVTYCKDREKWASQINSGGRHIFLGRFDTAIEAAAQYNKSAEELFGEFAILNPIPGVSVK